MSTQELLEVCAAARKKHYLRRAKLCGTDESIAVIAFSAKGHTFEGVRERFAAHRGNVLISMDDFKDLTVEVVDKKHKTKQMFRDHGHEASIKGSYEMVRPKNGHLQSGWSVQYVWETGNLFLKTRQALEENRQVIIHFDETRLGTRCDCLTV